MMLRIFFRTAPAFVLICLCFTITASAQQSARLDEKAVKAKAVVAKRGTGEKARVTVRMRDGREHKGHIVRSEANGFTILDKKTSQQIDIGYNEVQKVKGGGWSLAAKIGLATAIAVGIVVVVVVLSLPKDLDGPTFGVPVINFP